MRSILFLSLLMASSAFAGDYVQLNCKVADPCLHASGLGNRCVNKIEISGRLDQNNQGPLTQTVTMSHSNPTFDFKLVPQKHQIVAVKHSHSIEFYGDNGDTWGKLLMVPGAIYKGPITLDQDFEFEVSCIDEAIGFELE